MAAPAPATQPASAAATEPEPERQSTLGAVARAAISHLAPVSRAEAAPAAQDPGETWGIQIGAYREAAAAERAQHKLDRLAVADGKESEVLGPAPGDRKGLYRVRLMHFSSRAAHAACEELHRQGIACSIVPPTGLKVASR
jgi:cell division protein FtsN